ncbi:alanyl-tRNA editing protein [Desulfopila sp. IMCC35006]|uniref:alanyl-tRNA editing protein n=1 Tax=Desulfopila sp. IMCC35006 TaxID=2569542 RepID=UPI0010ACDAD4|nr:alanyl-tRNA editing protein [Desulfopila sp. IMCC35006]TKB25661.1 alanyl-tRNA editing protein [Desulfopila sp. IMCC35006]
MTQKTFWVNPYQTFHKTIVASVDGNDITLQSTIFFAFSGGQESDHGTIGGKQVISARKEGLEIVYTLAENHGLTVGKTVDIEIDWTRRYRLMRLHFAAELILELFYKSLDGVDKVGAHIAETKARIDFSWPESIAPMLPEFTLRANQIIEADLEIKCAFDDVVTERRYWEIDGFSRVLCGGTHVKRTGEVGQIRLKRNNIGRGKERVEIFLAS